MYALRQLMVTLPFGIAFALLVGFFILASSWEQERVRREFVVPVEPVADELKFNIQRYLAVLPACCVNRASARCKPQTAN